MNAHTQIDLVDTTMTSKGQVLIPKAFRDRAGLIPNRPVRVGVNGEGQVVIVPGEPETPDQRKARIRAAIEAVRGTVDFGFGTTDDYMDMIRPHRLHPQ